MKLLNCSRLLMIMISKRLITTWWLLVDWCWRDSWDKILLIGKLFLTFWRFLNQVMVLERQTLIMVIEATIEVRVQLTRILHQLTIGNYLIKFSKFFMILKKPFSDLLTHPDLTQITQQCMITKCKKLSNKCWVWDSAMKMVGWPNFVEWSLETLNKFWMF